MALNPPEFVWRARMHLGQLLTATVEDEYLDGIGSIDARLWGVITLLHPEPHPHLNEGALLRYLAEAAWFPVALLPSARLHWQAAGKRSAVATLRDGTISPSTSTAVARSCTSRRCAPVCQEMTTYLAHGAASSANGGSSTACVFPP